ncbi:carbohydrate-binding module family 12 protein [Gymnopilus junonius]|uniref:Carbohydrate-binding module family 12 protein n=1 Tax=Gymnopilus junonius TaxID=109634 RepID=A0A9P5NLR9_GYMJU|nr:carbohydrate-binding module family 12 protein [Gymnopilus junonius]
MTQYWEPGTAYSYGDIVEYEGHHYKIVQPHTSQSDWTPAATPALWGRLSDEDHNTGGDNKYQSGYQQQQPYQPPQQQPQYGQQGQSQEDQKPDHWYETEEGKKKLEIGGGLLGGAALLAGGLLAYKKHEEHKEHSRADGWARENWLQEASARTEAYRRNGTEEPCLWVFTQGKHIPKGAILVGKEKSWNLYICRAFYDGGLQLGKASDAFKKGGVLGYKDDEIHVEEFEVLIGDMNRLKWVPVTGRINVASLGYRPVTAGQENDGTPLYIVEAPYKDAVHPGKTSEKLDGAYIPYDGKEKHVREYRVLCYAPSY